jgi:hypothetical protein
MDFSFKKYPEIERHFGEHWLNDPKSTGHPLFRIYHENQYLTDFNEYLRDVDPRKSTSDQLRNLQQFWDIYYEFEIAYFLRKLGLNPILHKKICRKIPDIFLEKEKTVIEIKHLNIPDKIEQSTMCFDPKLHVHDVPEAVNVTFINMERMLNRIEKNFQDVYPNIVCFCPEVSAGDCSDLENLIEKHKVSEKISALAIWRRKKLVCFLENPCGKKLELESSKLQRFFNPKA